MSKEAFDREVKRIRAQRERTEKMIYDYEMRQIFQPNTEYCVALARAIAADRKDAKLTIPDEYLR